MICASMKVRFPIHIDKDTTDTLLDVGISVLRSKQVFLLLASSTRSSIKQQHSHLLSSLTLQQ